MLTHICLLTIPIVAQGREEELTRKGTLTGRRADFDEVERVGLGKRRLVKKTVITWFCLHLLVFNSSFVPAVIRIGVELLDGTTPC